MAKAQSNVVVTIVNAVDIEYGKLGEIVAFKKDFAHYGKEIGDIFVAGSTKIAFIRDGGIMDKDHADTFFVISLLAVGETVTFEQE